MAPPLLRPGALHRFLIAREIIPRPSILNRQVVQCTIKKWIAPPTNTMLHGSFDQARKGNGSRAAIKKRSLHSSPRLFLPKAPKKIHKDQRCFSNTNRPGPDNESDDTPPELKSRTEFLEQELDSKDVNPEAEGEGS